MYLKNSVNDRQLWYLCISSAVIGVAAFFAAKILLYGIAFFTNLFYLQKISFDEIHLAAIQPKLWFLFIPVAGGIIVGLIAKFGSAGIRGHGIPEAMEKILYGDSKIPRRMTFLKPLASAIAIGSGGPFGAEGPIIATGASLGSWIGRHTSFNAHQRKILLAAGAAAGMTAVFGTPLSAILICIELLLFEFSASSFVPVVVAVATSYTIRLALGQTHPVFEMDNAPVMLNSNILFYFFTGLIVGAISCAVSKLVFVVEDLFEKLPVHWMYWPAIGGLAVGTIGLIEPRSLGVGYINITDALHSNLLLEGALLLFVWKFISWVIALGSGTSGGTLAPLLTFGSSLGLVIGLLGQKFFPGLMIRPEMCALVGMSAMFAGATRAILTSTVFALEATGVVTGVAPLLMGNSAAYLMSMLFMKETIMTEKLSRRGKHVPSDYFHVKL